VNSWLDLLAPEDIGDRLRLVVSIPGWDDEKDSDGNWVDVAPKKAKELARELAREPASLSANLRLLLKGEQRQALVFGSELAKSHPHPEAFVSDALHCLKDIADEEGNPSLLCGFLRGVDNRGLIEPVLEETYQDDNLSTHLVELTRLSICTVQDLQRVLRAVRERRIAIRQVVAFSYNSVLDHLPVGDAVDFCDQIAAVSAEGRACALRILYMYCFHDENRWTAALRSFRDYIARGGLLAYMAVRPGHYIHEWEEAAIRLLKADDDATDLATILAAEIVQYCEQAEHTIYARHNVGPVLAVLLRDFFQPGWPVIGRYLLEGDYRGVSKLKHLFGRRNNREEMGEVLANAPIGALVEWCGQNSPHAARQVAKFMPVFQERSDDGHTWHELARSMIDEFGDDPEFLHMVSMNLGTFAWSGSTVPYYERQMQLMNELTSHLHVEVERWARERKEYLRATIAGEKARDEERDVGVF